MVLYLDKCSWCFVGHQALGKELFLDSHIGEECLVVKNYNYITKESVYRIYVDNGGVAGGKSAYHIERYHGIYCLFGNEIVCGLGLRRIEKVYGFENGRIKIRLSKDLKPFEE